jgi:tetratricopeptide (TPR) repeat protein
MALELMPHFEAARVVRGVAYIQLDPPRAVEELEEAARLSGRQPYTLSHLASAHAAAGNLEAARPIRDEIAAYASSGYVSSTLIAICEIAVGDLSAALDAFERAAAQRSPWLSYLLSEPRVDLLRAEPRFHALVASIGYGSTPSRLQL